MKIINDIKRKGLRFAIRRFDRLYGLGALEQMIAKNWFNPFLTVYVCLRSFPIKQAVRLPLYIYGRPRIYGLSGRMRVDGKLSTGMIHFNISHPGAPCIGSLQSELINYGQILFHGKCEISAGSKVKTSESGILEFGNNSKICEMCNIGCYVHIKMGNTTRLSHYSQIFDSNYHFMASLEKHTVAPLTSPIEIGNNCWICNSTSISKGAKIPDFTIVASHSLVNKDFSGLEKGSIIGGIPAKLIAGNTYRIENKKLHRILYKFFQESSERVFILNNTVEINDIL